MEVCSSCGTQDKPHMYCPSDLEKGCTEGQQDGRVENMSSPLLIKTPKPQLTAEQPSKTNQKETNKQTTTTTTTKNTLEPTKKDTLYPKTKEKPQQDRVKVLSLTSGFTAWESDRRRRRPQRIWLWRPVGFDCWNSTGQEERKTALLEGAHKVPCAPGPMEKISDLIRDWARPTC